MTVHDVMDPPRITGLDDWPEYAEFLRGKVPQTQGKGLVVPEAALDHPWIKPHVRAIVKWMVERGRAACFASFGLHKTNIQLAACKLARELIGGYALITLPLGVRQEFYRDAAKLGIPVKFVRSWDEVEDEDTIYLTNYETVRKGKLDPRRFSVTSLDEASVLRGFGGSKTFREFMRLFADDDRTTGKFGGGIPIRFVATATPSPNDYEELLAYSAYLGILDISAAKTRFFQRDSEKADNLTLRPSKEREFWLWLASWAIFCERPSDLGPEYSDEGYVLPPMDVVWHELPVDHAGAGVDRSGQGRMFRDSSLNVRNAAREKRSSLPARVAKLCEIVAADERPAGRQWVVWCDLNQEQEAAEKALRALGLSVASLTGAQPLEERERLLDTWRDRAADVLLSKPVLLGSGVNLQQCNRAVFLGIGFKFNDFIQACHRVQRFGQKRPVRLDLIYTEAEQQVRRILEGKWRRHTEQVATMTALLREYGLAQVSLASALGRSMGIERREASGPHHRLVSWDSILEARCMPDDSVGLITTSIPFGTQYEYSASYADLGHTDDDAHFWRQMGFLTPNLLRVLQPGRVCAVHVKDRIVPGGLSNLGFQTVNPFSDDTIRHFRAHGFAFLGRITVVTDVVRENNQTYRLGWTEQCKDGSRMGNGLPEYVLLFRKPPTDRSNGYADVPVVKPKTAYSRSRWQIDAHGFWRSSGDRLLASEEFKHLPHEKIFKLFRDYFLNNVYDYEQHVALGEQLESLGPPPGRLPVKFMLLQPPSHHPDVWTDVARMRSLNLNQHQKGADQHLCLARGSLVLTRQGYKPIETVAVGDNVLTHKGRWRPVLAVQNTGVRPAVRVSAHGVTGLMLTPDHKLWTRRVRGIPWSRAHSRLDAKKTDPCWVPADETVGSYVNLKLPPVEAPSIESTSYWWIVGRWLADGHINKRDTAVISCARDELDELVATLGAYGGNKPSDSGTCYQIGLRDPGGHLRRTLLACGHGAGGKHLPPEAYVLPAEQARALLDGYLSGDGHFLPKKRRWSASSVSKELMLGMAILAQRAYGAVASVYPGRPERSGIIQGRAVRMRQDWILMFTEPAEGRGLARPFIDDEGAWRRVRAVEPVGEVETWNLRVDEDESYTAEGCVVKNCPLPLDIANRLITRFSMEGEVVFDPFAGLGTVPYCAVKLGRVGWGCELSEVYVGDAVGYLEAAERQLATPTLFDLLEVEQAGDSAPIDALDVPTDNLAIPEEDVA